MGASAGAGARDGVGGDARTGVAASAGARTWDGARGSGSDCAGTAGEGAGGGASRTQHSMDAEPEAPLRGSMGQCAPAGATGTVMAQASTPGSHRGNPAGTSKTSGTRAAASETRRPGSDRAVAVRGSRFVVTEESLCDVVDRGPIFSGSRPGFPG